MVLDARKGDNYKDWLRYAESKIHSWAKIPYIEYASSAAVVGGLSIILTVALSTLVIGGFMSFGLLFVGGLLCAGGIAGGMVWGLDKLLTDESSSGPVCR